jgi:hypothetical protein
LIGFDFERSTSIVGDRELHQKLHQRELCVCFCLLIEADLYGLSCAGVSRVAHQHAGSWQVVVVRLSLWVGGWLVGGWTVGREGSSPNF